MSQPFETHSATSAVVITIGEVYAEVRQMRTDVRDLVASLKPITRQVEDHEARLRKVDGLPDDVTAVAARVDDHEARMRGLERGKWLVTGGAAVLGGGVGSVVTVLLSHR